MFGVEKLAETPFGQVLLLLGLIAAFIIILVILFRGTRHDNVQFLWGCLRVSNDRRLRRILLGQQRELEAVDSLVSLVSHLNGELASALASGRPRPAREGVEHLYQMATYGVTRIVRPARARAAILFPDPAEQNILVLAHVHPITSAALQPRRWDRKGIAGQVHSTGEYYYCKDVDKDSRYRRDPHRVRNPPYGGSFVCMPILAARQALGVLLVDAVSKDAFNNDDISAIEAVSSFLAALRLVDILVSHEPMREVAPSEDPGSKDH